MDSSTRTFSGIPGSQDNGPVTLGLVATDSTGATSMAVTLIVSASPGPGVGTSATEQLPALGNTSSPDSLLMYPSSSFGFSFSPKTFTNTNQNTIYYAFCTNHTPLPSWIVFDANSLAFEGETPEFTSSTELPQDINIVLTASNVAGFSDTIVSFQIVIESHELTFGNDTHNVNVSANTPFSYSELQRDLLLDGKVLQPSDLNNVSAEMPEWMSLNEQTLVLSGTAPSSVSAQNFTVTATDIYGDVANTTLNIQADSSSDLIQGSIGTLNATIGSEFSYFLPPSLFSRSNLQVTVDTGNASSWLSFDPKALSLYGNVPAGLAPQRAELNLSVSQENQVQSQAFLLQLSTENSGSETASSSTKVSSTAKPAPSAQISNDPRVESARKRKIAVATVIPLLLISAMVGMVFCWRRRRQPNTYLEALGLTRRDISRPTGSEESFHCDMRPEMTEKIHYQHKRMASKPPKLEIPGLWTFNSSNRYSQTQPSRPPSNRNDQGVNHESWQLYPKQDTGSAKPNRSERGSQTGPQFTILQEDEVPLYEGRKSPNVRQHWFRNKRSSKVPGVSPRKRYSGHANRYSNLSLRNSSFVFPLRRHGAGHGKGFEVYPTKLSFRNGDRISKFSVSTSSIFHSRRMSGIGHGLWKGSNGYGPAGFGKVGKSWRNTSIDNWTSTTESISTMTSSANNLGAQDLSSAIESFPRPPTSKTFERSAADCTRSRLIEEPAITNDKLSIRPVISPSQPPLTIYMKRRRRNPNQALFSAGPSRASSHSTRATFPSETLTNEAPDNYKLATTSTSPPPQPPTNPLSASSLNSTSHHPFRSHPKRHPSSSSSSHRFFTGKVTTTTILRSPYFRRTNRSRSSLASDSHRRFETAADSEAEPEPDDGDDATPLDASYFWHSETQQPGDRCAAGINGSSGGRGFSSEDRHPDPLKWHASSSGGEGVGGGSSFARDEGRGWVGGMRVVGRGESEGMEREKAGIASAHFL
ncbi:hypothetical protein MMC20_001297 [Loxospora ochrophaea]|nr:hypothetical protein [Loxospora ochrophaea]